MAFKALLALSLLITLIIDQPIHVRGDMEGGHDMSDEKSIEKDGNMKDMKGTPMMCYKKSKAKKGDENASAKRLLEQSAKLLAMVMQKLNSGDELDVAFVNEATEQLKNMTKGKSDKKEEEGDTELGMELLGIVNRLIQGGQVEGLSVSEGTSEGNSGMAGLTPMNDLAVATPPTLPFPDGFDLSSFGLSMTELLDLFKDPSMKFMFESLGLGPFLVYLQNEETVEALSKLDIKSFNQLLVSGDIFTSDGQVNMDAIQQYVNMMQTGDANDKRMMNGTMTTGPKLTDNPLMMTLSSIMSLLGVNDELTPDNLIPSVFKAVLSISNASESTIDTLMIALSGVSDEDLEKWKMLPGMKSLDEMRESEDREMMAIFDSILWLADIQVNVTEDNLMETLITIFRFVATADETSLVTIVEMIGDMEYIKYTETSVTERTPAMTEGTPAMTDSAVLVPEETPAISRSLNIGPDVKPTGTPSTKSIKKNMTTSTIRMVETKPMEEMTTNSMEKTGNKKGLMESFQQLMRMAGVEDEVTEENLMESIMKAIQYILTTDEETLAALVQMMDSVDIGEGASMGMTSMGDMKSGGSVKAVFDRIMALAGVGQVTDENLLESVMKAMRYLMSADEETMAGIVRMMGETTMNVGTTQSTDANESDEQGKGHSTDMKTMKDESYTKEKKDMPKSQNMTGDGKTIIEIFERILALTGNEEEVTEENVVEKTLSAMDFILQADKDALALILQEFNKLDLGDMATMMGEDDDKKKEGDMKERYEMICNPMNEKEVNKYMMENNMMTESKDMKDSTKTGGMTNPVTMKPTKEVEVERDEAKDKDMKCGSCRSDEEMKTMMKEMVEMEVSRVFAEVVTNMNSVSAVAPEVQVFLSKMANGMLPAEFKTPVEAPGTTISPGPMQDSFKWEEWSSFGECTQTCGGGQRIRTRVCTKLYQERNRGDSMCEQTETTNCNDMACPTTETTEPVQLWLEWENWLPCSATCGSGTSTRRRECFKRSEAESCEQVQTQSCFIGPCSTSSMPATFMPTTTEAKTVELPFWKEWEEWAPCSLTCGLGVTTRKRTCNRAGNGNCVQMETQNCMTRTCPMITTVRTTTAPRVPVFSNWANWGTCSTTCGGGLRKRGRSCLSGPCSGVFEQFGRCSNFPCPTASTVNRLTSKMMDSSVKHRSTMVPATATALSAVRRALGGICLPSAYKQLRYGDKCIIFHGKESGMKSFADYRRYCQKRGGDLLRTVDVEKWVQVAYWMKSIFDTNSYRNNLRAFTWIGATDAGEHGRWSHPEDRTMKNKRNFMIWSRGQPEAAEYDQCAILNVVSGHALGESCSQRNYAICEY